MEKEIKIIYEDDGLLVINKPYGVVVNRADSVSGASVQDWADEYLQISGFGKPGSLFEKRSGICHRLDKETSGCLMIAKTPEALEYYLNVFQKRRISKQYTALVHGLVTPRVGDVILPIKRSLMDREKFMVHYLGKRAVTEWSVTSSAYYDSQGLYNNSLSLLKVSILTGRTHQIRVHMSFLGWPIFADDKYLTKKILEMDSNHLSHHFLHASRLEFENTESNKLVVESDIDDDMKTVCQKFGLL
jgi:23S rRNA pseudouridine1911/1915/1917 synthase